VTETSAGVIELNLGSVAEQLWNSRPELPHIAGHELTKEQFIQMQIGLI